jgi:sorbitol-specific phosphotransferase system component IIBC
MAIDNKYIHNVGTDEITVEPVTAADKKDLAEQAKLNAEKAKIREAEQAVKNEAKQAILDRIGLTADELQTILG